MTCGLGAYRKGLKRVTHTIRRVIVAFAQRTGLIDVATPLGAVGVLKKEVVLH